MNDLTPYIIIRQAIQSADVDYPNIEPGVTRDRIFRSNEESEHLTQAIIQALKRNGFTITRGSNA